MLEGHVEMLRRALGHTLPPQIVTRKKMGFPTPTREWFRGPYRLAMQRLLLGPRTLSTEFVEPEYVRRMLEAEPPNERARFFEFNVSSEGLVVTVS